MTVSPLPNSTRELLHTRQVICTGYRRSDGFFDIEGRLLDTKTHSTTTPYKVVDAGAPFHQMLVVMTLDIEFIIHALVARTEVGPTPYCSDINAAYATLTGLHIGPGFKKEVLKRLGGFEGCTHLTELLSPMATTAYQTILSIKRKAEQDRLANDPGYPLSKPWILGKCYAYREGGEAAKLIWPDTGNSTL